MTTFRDLFVEHIGPALERQLDLEDKIGPCDFHLDLPAGTVAFDTPGEALVVPMQVLGSEAEASARWVAGWSLDASKVATRLTEASRRLKAIGEKEKIPELAGAKVPLDDVDGEKYSIVASGLLAAPGYYRAPFRGGAMFVLLEDKKLASKPERPGARILEVFRRAADILTAAEQRRAFTAYVRYHGGTLREEPRALHATFASESLSAKVDADGTVHGLDLT